MFMLSLSYVMSKALPLIKTKRYLAERVAQPEHPQP